MTRLIPYVLLLMSLTGYIMHARVKETVGLITHSDEVMAQTARCLQGMVDAETGVRGFLLNNDEEFLAPYLTARKSIEEATRELKRLTAVRPEQTERAAKLESRCLAQMAVLDYRVAIARRRNAGDELAEARAAKKGMDDVRGQIDEMRSEVEKDLAERASRYSQDMRTFQMIFLGCFGVSAVIVCCQAAPAVLRRWGRRSGTSPSAC